eukprot:gene96-225_t
MMGVRYAAVLAGAGWVHKVAHALELAHTLRDDDCCCCSSSGGGGWWCSSEDAEEKRVGVTGAERRRMLELGAADAYAGDVSTPGLEWQWGSGYVGVVASAHLGWRQSAIQLWRHDGPATGDGTVRQRGRDVPATQLSGQLQGGPPTLRRHGNELPRDEDNESLSFPEYLTFDMPEHDESVHPAAAAAAPARRAADSARRQPGFVEVEEDEEEENEVDYPVVAAARASAEADLAFAAEQVRRADELAEEAFKREIAALSAWPKGQAIDPAECSQAYRGPIRADHISEEVGDLHRQLTEMVKEHVGTEELAEVFVDGLASKICCRMGAIASD